MVDQKKFLDSEGVKHLWSKVVYALRSEIPTKVSAFTNDAGYLTEHQDISGKLDSSALPTAINTALAQAKASGEFDGANGKDGTSITHSWNGTTLNVTSASGTSSADLKGVKGDTPVKGVDYFTTSDIQEIVDAVYAKVADGNEVAY